MKNQTRRHLALPYARSQFLDNLVGCLKGCGVLGDIERNGADPRVPAAAVALADPGKVDQALGARPWV